MDLKRKSTLSKAFSRFRRKSVSQPDTTSAPTAAPAPNSEPAAAPDSEPAAALNSEPAAASDKHDGNDISNDNANDNIQPSSTANVSPPGSPLTPSMHQRGNTGISNASNTSHQGLSSSEDNSPEDGLNPADILLNRMTAYRTVLKDLQKYFTEIALIESGIGKAMHKASNMIVVPFKDGTQFMGKGGFQDVCIGVHNSTRVRGDQHANAARFIEETIVINIRRLKQDIKTKIKAFKLDANLYETRVFKEREATQGLIGNLAKAIGLFENSGGHQLDMEKTQSDPYLINVSLRRQLAKQVNEENLFARALYQCQEQVMMFEKHIINEVKQVLGSFAVYQLGQGGSGFSQSWAPTEMALNVLQEDSEWKCFLERNGHRLFPSELVDANPEELDYPCKESPFVSPVMTAHLSRQSSVLKNWKEGFFVLTLSGWLHVFASADLMAGSVPERSIYIPTATLGPHTEAGQKQHVFSLEGKGMKGILHRDAQTFTLRANSREEMLEWWTEISKRAHATMFSQLGDGQLGGSLSRSGSVMRSSSLLRSGSKATRPQTPMSSNQEPAPTYSSHGEFAGAEGVAPVAQSAAP
ncbi:hypothetical protein BGX26_002896, partial [Mortierella sp. AD094]